MNIVYLIGNGFDLNLGMKTSYRNFCEYYTSLPKDSASVVERLKAEIKGDIGNWSDFELALGKFLDDRVESEDAIVLYNHLIEHLQEYIETEENKYIFDNTQKDIFHEYLSKPYTENRLLPTEWKAINDVVSNMGRNDWYVKIITFNYTRSIEKFLGSSIGENIQIGTNRFNYKVFLSAMEHIHGFTNERMILGVNDESQIANAKLREDTYVTDRYVKSYCNNRCRLGHDEKCQQWINNASLVCLFGLSFGDTDKRWWDMVGNVLRRGGKVIIFEHKNGTIPDGNRVVDRYELEEKVKDRFLSKTTISENSKIAIKKNIHIALNTDMFKFDNLKNCP